MRWRLIVAVVGGILVLAAFTLPLVATATDDVAFCMSCHIMAPEGESHAASFHRNAATCSDCHTGSLVQKYTDGVRHIVANVTGHHPEPITLREQSRAVVAGQCYSCHQDSSNHARAKHAKGQNCLDCHSGHDPRPVNLPGTN